MIDINSVVVKGRSKEIENFIKDMDVRKIQHRELKDEKDLGKDARVILCRARFDDKKIEEFVALYPKLKICYWEIDYRFGRISSGFSDSGEYTATYSGEVDEFDDKDEDLFINDTMPYEDYKGRKMDTRTDCFIRYDYKFDYKEEWYNDEFVD